MNKVARIPLTTPPPRTPVNARTVAAFLGIRETTVYSLMRGIRGWEKIEVLPHVADVNVHKRDRYTFFLDDIRDWRERTGFKVKPQGRGRKRASSEKTN